MSKLRLSSVALAIGLVMAPLYSVNAVANDTVTTHLTKGVTNNGIVPARQFVLEQPGELTSVITQQNRSNQPSPLQSTGYWLTKGETVSINVDYTASTAPYLHAFISVPHDRTRKFGRASKIYLSRGSNTFQVPQDGILYIASYYDSIGSDININIASGGKPMPRFILGQNTSADWKAMLSNYSYAPYAEMVGDHMMLTMRRDKAQEYIDAAGPEAVLRLWDKMVNVASEQYGLTDESATSVHHKVRHRFHFIDGVAPAGVINNDECGGEMNAWSWRMQTCGDYALKKVVNTATLNSREGWGPIHELGHMFQMKSMQWTTDMLEVSVNLTSMYIQREFGIPSSTVTNWQEKIFPYLNQATRDYNANDDVFIKLGMFWQLDLTFGKDFYARLARSYRDSGNFPSVDDARQQRFILETSKVSGFNLTPFFEKWGLAVSSATQQQLKQLNQPVIDTPIWENSELSVKYDYSDHAQDEAPAPTPQPDVDTDTDEDSNNNSNNDSNNESNNDSNNESNNDSNNESNNDNTPAYPAWNSGTTYSQPCNKVSYNGKNWANGWWTKGQAPSSSDAYGVWREIGSATMHSQCR